MAKKNLKPTSSAASAVQAGRERSPMKAVQLRRQSEVLAHVAQKMATMADRMEHESADSLEFYSVKSLELAVDSVINFAEKMDRVWFSRPNAGNAGDAP